MDALAVCVASIRAHLSEDIEICAVDLAKLQERGLYQRPWEIRGNQMFDVISDAPMSTAFAISRFAVPLISEGGLALFCDCDFLFRADLVDLFAEADPRFAVQVVKHEHKPTSIAKMDMQIQTVYPRKNWSSCMLLNCDHPANRQLTWAKINAWSGRALHNFSWLEDFEIGELSPDWNHLVGVNAPNPTARGVHFTEGLPRMIGYEECEHASEWLACLEQLSS